MSKHGIGTLRAAQIGKAFDAATGTKDKRAATVGKQFGLKSSTVLNYVYVARQAAKEKAADREASAVSADESWEDTWRGETRSNTAIEGASAAPGFTDELVTLQLMIESFMELSPVSRTWITAWFAQRGLGTNAE